METGEFERGETKAHLKAITKDIGAISQEMKDHNAGDKVAFEKIDTQFDETKTEIAKVAVLAREASELAYRASQKATESDRKVDKRHEENQAALSNINEKIETKFGTIGEKIDVKFEKIDKKIDENFQSTNKEINKLSGKLSTVYGVAAGIAFAAGFVGTWFKDKIMRG